MALRAVFWSTGGLLGVAAAAAVPESLFPGAKPVVFGLTWFAAGCVGEGLDRASRKRTNRGALPGPDPRPADGRVDVAILAGFKRRPNPVDPRFGVFLGLEPGATPAVDRARRVGRRSPPLRGRVVVASLFVGRGGRSWTDEEVAASHASLVRAGAWVENEAIRYGAAVNLEVADTYFVFDDDAEDDVALGFWQEGDEVGPMEENATTKALVRASRAALALGFHDAENLFRAVEVRTGADAVVWLIHPREAGRSFAVPVEDAAVGGLSLAVCYPKESSFPEALRGPARCDPVTVVHETLHLFGATDKYGRSFREFAPKLVTSREVMRLSEVRLNRLRVDPLTAAEIGWATGPGAGRRV